MGARDRNPLGKSGKVKANSTSRSSLMAPVISLSIGSLEKYGFLGCNDV